MYRKGDMEMGKQTAWEEIDKKSSEIFTASDEIWGCAETAFTEEKSMKILCDVLKAEGFTVETGLADVKTAFKGTFGSGKPVIGILGEFDALSGLDQEAGATEKIVVHDGASGHGCGHNMLGTASLSAAIGIKKYLEESGKPGTVIYFGCPGEEGGSGKAFMAKGGVFADLDAAITWHPGDLTQADTGSSLANYQVAYKFYGKSAHAGGAPHLGRSALDALELMNMGVQFLREHVVPEARIHYAITNTGGYSPNVVQPYAEVLYLIRAPKNSQVEEIYQRVNKIAEGHRAVALVFAEIRAVGQSHFCKVLIVTVRRKSFFHLIRDDIQNFFHLIFSFFSVPVCIIFPRHTKNMAIADTDLYSNYHYTVSR